MKEGKISIECDTLEQYEEFKKKAEKVGYIIKNEKIQDLSDIVYNPEIGIDIRNYFITFILEKVK